MLLPIVRTKLNPPELLPNTLLRPRLVERFANALRRRVVLISAPAGYGKTTLLAQALAEWRTHQEAAISAEDPAQLSILHSQFRLAWLTLDQSDNDPRQFLAYLIAALQMLSADQRARASAAVHLTPPPTVEPIIADLLNDLAELNSETLIVLEDYHTISSPEVQHAIGFLIDHLPPRSHLVIASRADPSLPLARLRARGHLAELRAADLGFTPEECAAFLLETMDLSLSRNQVAALVDRTEGWPAGLHLSAIALRDRPDQAAFLEDFTGNHRYIVDYLIEDVFARLPGHIQTFLLQTSFLDRLCGPLCDAVLGIAPAPVVHTETGGAHASARRSSFTGNQDSYSRLILDTLERDNLFLVPLDAERDWYRYHHLFGDVLRERLLDSTSSEQLVMLNRRASAWYAAHGYISAAVSHALRAGAIDDVVGIIEPIGLAMATRVGEATLRAWLPAIPDEQIRARPRLALLRAWLALSDYDRSQAEAWLEIAEDALARVATGAINGIGNVTNLRGEIYAVRARLATFIGDAPQVIEDAGQALALLQSDNLALRTRVSKDLGYAYLTLRDIGRAEQAFAEAMTNGFSAGYPYISFMATSDYAYLQYARGGLRAAASACRQTITRAGDTGSSSSPGSGLPYLALADISRERHEFAGVLPSLAEAESRISPNNTTGFLCLMIVEARVARAQGDATRALSSIRQARFIAQNRRLIWAAAILDSMEAQILITLGDLEAAARLIERVQAIPEPAEFRFFPPAFVFAAEHCAIAPLQLRLARGLAAEDMAALRELVSDLEDLICDADKLSVSSTQMKLRVFQAQAYVALGMGQQAYAVLRRALNLGLAEGYIDVFVTMGPALCDLITRLGERNPWKADEEDLAAYAERLIALCVATPRNSNGGAATQREPGSPATSARGLDTGTAALPEPLSSRELDVLRLMADGQSNNEIAASLIIAISTVKSHVNNIFSKLGVATRTQAIARARRLELI